MLSNLRRRRRKRVKRVIAAKATALVVMAEINECGSAAYLVCVQLPRHAIDEEDAALQRLR